ncbi:heat shock protein 90-5, chloroplastic-like [Bidens hawaiensis]|uniref:heat shock protein 90-5, chloroplastic-like n=1 Tax=Bidens hawaiensis TaxID=980011 RepID=UPI00404B11ED
MLKLNQDWAKRFNLLCSGLKLNVDKRWVFNVRCEASAVAEKEVGGCNWANFSLFVVNFMFSERWVSVIYTHIVAERKINHIFDDLDKLRFLSATDPSLLGDVGELEIRFKPDPEKGIITIL